jgi:hypothetical protein
MLFISIIHLCIFRSFSVIERVDCVMNTCLDQGIRRSIETQEKFSLSLSLSPFYTISSLSSGTCINSARSYVYIYCRSKMPRDTNRK